MALTTKDFPRGGVAPSEGSGGNMKVEILSDCFAGGKSYEQGKKYEITNDIATQLIAVNRAVKASDDVKKPKEKIK